MNIPARLVVHHDLFRCLGCKAVSHYVRSEEVHHREPIEAPSGQAAIDPVTGEPVMLEWTSYILRCIQCDSPKLEKVSCAALPFQSHLREFENALYKITHPAPGGRDGRS
jgi:Fe-S-cluster-containing dehydrogenase component